MQPYVIRQGDDLLSLAYKFGFDADAVWNDPKNALLRQLRPNPNILWPTDILYIPEQIDKKPVMHKLVIGTTNTFVSNAPPITVMIRLVDPAFASQPFTIKELPALAGLSTAADGTARLQIPITQRKLTILFASVDAEGGDASPATFSIGVGHLDPIHTLSGVVQRLQNLGYMVRGAAVDELPLDAIRTSLRAFKAANAPPASDAFVSPAAAAAASSQPDDDGGMTDAGKLDDSTSQMLRSAHGS